MPAVPMGIYYYNENGVTEAWSGGIGGGSWTNSAYRTITLEQPATGDLLTWLQRNAVKQ